MTEDPWKDLDPPGTRGTVAARRVDPEIHPDFFWARGIDGRYLLLLQHSLDAAPAETLPQFRGLEIQDIPDSDGTSATLLLRLLDSGNRDIFLQLCRDIVASASATGNEKDAVRVTLARTWRWHRLLTGALSGRLSLEEQQGLLGELSFLTQHLFEILSVSEAVASWRGPLGAPKDFEIGKICVEVKARRGPAAPVVRISSEYQLDTQGIDSLFLYVADIQKVPSGTDGAMTLSEYARRILDRIAVSGPASSQRFEELLAAAGLSWDDDYADDLWTLGETKFYEVADGFPRLTGSLLDPSVSRVTYSLALSGCDPFRVTAEEFETRLKATWHGR